MFLPFPPFLVGAVSQIIYLAMLSFERALGLSRTCDEGNYKVVRAVYRHKFHPQLKGCRDGEGFILLHMKGHCPLVKVQYLTLVYEASSNIVHGCTSAVHGCTLPVQGCTSPVHGCSLPIHGRTVQRLYTCTQ